MEAPGSRDGAKPRGRSAYEPQTWSGPPRWEARARLKAGSKEGKRAGPGGGCVLQLIEAKEQKGKRGRREHLDVVRPDSFSQPTVVRGWPQQESAFCYRV